MLLNCQDEILTKYYSYHGCGRCYLDGTNETAIFGCINRTFNPFCKNPIDINNKISKSTRYQIKKKRLATRKYVRKYFNYLNFLENIKDTQSDSDCSKDSFDYDTETESETESKAATTQNQNSNLKPELTGENLIIDIAKNNVKTETGEVLVINITLKRELDTKQNPENK